MGNPGDSSVGQFFKGIDLDPRNSTGAKLLGGDYQSVGRDVLGAASEGGKKLIENGTYLTEGLLNPTGAFNRLQSDQAAGRRRDDLAAQQSDIAKQQQADWAMGQEQAQRDAAEKKLQANMDYVGKYNKGLADEEAMKALQEAKASTRRKVGREVNFF